MRDVTRKSIFQLFSHNHNEMFMKLEKISLKNDINCAIEFYDLVSFECFTVLLLFALGSPSIFSAARKKMILIVQLSFMTL